jgi:hypothetical protein
LAGQAAQRVEAGKPGGRHGGKLWLTSLREKAELAGGLACAKAGARRTQ